MIIEKMITVAAVSAFGGVLADALAPDNISTTFIGVCATVLLFVVKELITLNNRMSKLESKIDSAIPNNVKSSST